MLGEAIVAGLTLVTLGSLWLANQVEKRSHEWDGPDGWLEPFHKPLTDLKCPMCQIVATKTNPEWGPNRPEACELGEQCSGFPVLHHHVSCGYCKAKWMRRAAADKS